MEPTPAFDVDVLDGYDSATAAWAGDTAGSAYSADPHASVEEAAAPEYRPAYDSGRNELSVCVALLAALVGTLGLRYLKKTHPYMA